MNIVYDSITANIQYIINISDFRGKEIKFYDASIFDCTMIKFTNDFKDVHAVLPSTIKGYSSEIITGEHFEKFCWEERKRLIKEKVIRESSDTFWVDYKVFRYILDMSDGKEIAWFSIFPPKVDKGIFGYCKAGNKIYRFVEGTAFANYIMAMNYAKNLIKYKDSVITKDGLELYLQLLEDKIVRPVDNLFIGDPENFFFPAKLDTIYEIDNTTSLMDLFTGEDYVVS